VNVDERKAKVALLRGREVRSLASPGFECREDGGIITIAGYACVTGVTYDMGFYQEQVSRGAFAKTLSERPDAQLLVNHEGLPLARTTIPPNTIGALTLREDDHGLFFEASADAGDPDAQRLATKIRSGLMDQCSFAFRALRSEWDEDYTARDIKEVSIDRGDVSVCNYGASPTTSVSVRAVAEYLQALSSEECEALLRSLRPTEEAPVIVTVQSYLAAMGEVREGKSLSTDTLEVLQNVLDMVSVADDNVDEAQEVLSSLMGVANPDDDDQGNETDEGRAAGETETLAIVHDLDLYRARAHALSLRFTA
jgi:HK97 family phage prohead protease